MSLIYAAVFDTFGTPAEVMRYTKIAMPEPGLGEVRVKLVLSPIHNHDLLIIRGMYGFKPSLPYIGGSEALAVVDKLGEGVTNLAIGNRVIAAGISSAWSEYFIAHARSVIPIPETLPDEIAAQLVGMPVGAMMALNKLKFKTNEWIIVNAANGAVGKTIAQIAVSRGIRVACLVTRTEAKQDLENCGASDIFITTDPNWRTSLTDAIGNNRVAGGIDMISGTLAGEMLHLISEGGLLLSFGNMSNKPMQIEPADLIFKEITIKGFWGTKESERTSANEMRAMISELIQLGLSGQLKLPVAKIFSLSRIADAVTASDQKRNGKIMIRP